MEQGRAARQRGVAGSTILLLALAVLIGAAVGIGSYTLVYAEGLSYMSSEPKVCANCHIMQAQYDSWQKSSQRLSSPASEVKRPAALKQGKGRNPAGQGRAG